jgi:hypothetical protein
MAFNWRERFTKIPKIGIVAGSATAGAVLGFGLPGAVVGLIVGLLVDREMRGGPLFPQSFHGEGTWKVYRYDPTSGHFVYAGMVNAGTEGSALEEASTQVFSASAYSPYTLPGFTNVYITSQGDVFRVGIEN